MEVIQGGPVSPRIAQVPPQAESTADNGSGTDFYIKGLFVLALLYSFYFARTVILPVVLALLFTLILSPSVRGLRRLGITEPLGAAVVVLGVISVLGLGLYQLFGPASDWVKRLPANIEQVEDKLRSVRHSVQGVTQAAKKVEEIARVDDKKGSPPEVVPREPSLINRILAGTQSVIFSAAATVVLLYFLLASGDLFLRKVVRVLPTLTDKKTAVGVARAIESDMARYLFTITCINAGLGVATATAMYLLDMPNPVLWGAMAAVCNYIPYLGAAATICVLTFVAFLTFDDPASILAVPGVQLVLVTLEGQILTPVLTGRSLTLNPVVIFIAMLFWGWLWGVVGALIAVPMLMTFRIFCEHIEGLAHVGEFLSGKRDDAADETS